MNNSYFDFLEDLYKTWHYDHPRILYSFVRALKPEVVVEVGAYRGYCACYLAKAIKENNKGRLFVIDNFSLVDHVPKYGDPKQHLMDNFRKAGVSDVITLIEGNSTEVTWPSKVDFAYVDGWHSYTICKHDVSKCLGLGASLVAFDDTRNCIGPKLFLKHFRKENHSEFDILEVGSDNGMGIIMRRPDSHTIDFSQELSGPGDDLTKYTHSQKMEYWEKCKASTGIYYEEMP